MKIGLLGLLTLVFVIAKLLNVISWSWWLVFSPALLGLAISVVVIATILGFAFWSERKSA